MLLRLSVYLSLLSFLFSVLRVIAVAVSPAPICVEQYEMHYEREEQEEEGWGGEEE